MLTLDEINKLKSSGLSQKSATSSLLDRVGIQPKKIGPKTQYEDVLSKFKDQEISQADETTFRKPDTGLASMKGRGNISKENVELWKKAPPESKHLVEEMDFQENPPLPVKILKSSLVTSILKTVNEKSSDIGLKTISAIQAIGENTYKEAMASWQEAKNDSTNSKFTRVLYGLQDQIPKMLIAMGLSAVTKSPGLSFATVFGVGAVESERQRTEGKFGKESVVNIGIDTALDAVIGKYLGYVYGKPASTILRSFTSGLAKTVTKVGTGALIEGSTEVTQSFLRFANTYNAASSPEQKQKVIQDFKDYISSGDMAVEFGVGSIAGGLATGGTIVAQSQQFNSRVKKAEGIVDNHVMEARDVIAETPEYVAENKQAFIDQTKTNIADELTHDGLLEQADRVRSIDTSGITSLDQLLEQSKLALEDAKVEMQLNTEERDRRSLLELFRDGKAKAGDWIYQSELVKNQRAKAVDSLEVDYSKWMGETISGKKALTKAEQRTRGLNYAGTEGRTPQRVLAEYGMIPETEGTKFSTFDQAQRMREATRPFVQAERTAIDEINWSVAPKSIDKLISEASAKVNKLYLTLGDKESIIKDITSEFERLRLKYGDTITIKELQEEKGIYFGNTGFELARPFKTQTNYNIGSVMQKSIETMAREGGYEDVAQLNREIGDIMAAASFLEKLDGRSLKYGKIGKYLFMGVGASLGRTAVGKVFGALGGEFISHVLMSADVATPVKRLLLANLQKNNPQAYIDTLDWIRARGLQKELQLALPPASRTYVEPTQNGQPFTPNRDGLITTPIVETQSQPQALDINMATAKQTNVSNIPSNNNTKTEKNQQIPNKQGGFIQMKSEDLTTKVLQRLEGRDTVSKQFIMDLTNSGDLKQVERDLIRSVLATEGDKVDVAKFAEKVKQELLPLKIKKSDINSVLNSKDRTINVGGQQQTIRGGSNIIQKEGSFRSKWEYVVLPSELRGNVANYSEHIYESPIKTSAGSTHFGGASDNYFGHTRIEDMSDKKVRRVIEVQSDLYQKGNLDTLSEGQLKYPTARTKELQKLQQYNDPTAHFRMVREEIKRAAQDGKTKLQFPTGETAMKIEGLGEQNSWVINDETRSALYPRNIELTADKLKVGKKIINERGFNGDPDANEWIITDVLGDGKFKAVPKDIIDNALSLQEVKDPAIAQKLIEGKHLAGMTQYTETFDISGKVDTSNPIYKFYEKDLGRYLKNNFDAQTVTDDKGVTWMEVDIKPEMAKKPVQAFGFADMPIIYSGALAGLATSGIGMGISALLSKLGFGDDEPKEEKVEDRNLFEPDTIKSLDFSENKIPTITQYDGVKTTIDKINLNLPEVTNPIKELIFTENGKKGMSRITDSKQLEVANKIKQISDIIAPQYTDYLIRTAWNEGGLSVDARKDNGEKGIDRGIFQINTKAFPQITDEQAEDIQFSVLWAISLIEAKKQSRWVSNKKNKNTKVEIIYAD